MTQTMTKEAFASKVELFGFEKAIFFFWDKLKNRLSYFSDKDDLIIVRVYNLFDPNHEARQILADLVEERAITFSNWQNIRVRTESYSDLHKHAFKKMVELEKTILEKIVVHYVASSNNDKASALQRIEIACTTVEDCKTLNAQLKPELKAIAKKTLNNLESTFKELFDTLKKIEARGDFFEILFRKTLAAATTFEQLKQTYEKAANNENPIRLEAIPLLRKKAETFDQYAFVHRKTQVISDEQRLHELADPKIIDHWIVLCGIDETLSGQWEDDLEQVIRLANNFEEKLKLLCLIPVLDSRKDEVLQSMLDLADTLEQLKIVNCHARTKEMMQQTIEKVEELQLTFNEWSEACETICGSNHDFYPTIIQGMVNTSEENNYTHQKSIYSRAPDASIKKAALKKMHRIANM